MKKYYIGLIILAVISLGLVGYVITQGAASKEDKKTYEKATQIAEKLNTYTSSKGDIPKNLNDAGISDVPTNITYTKKDDSTYEFCVTYKSNGNNYIEPVTQIFGGGVAGYDDYSSYSAYEQSYLYVDSYYKAGKNCKTIKPYQYGSDINGGNLIDPDGLNFNKNSTTLNSNNSCEVLYSSNYGEGKIVGEITVSSVDTTNKTISFSKGTFYDSSFEQVPVTFKSIKFNDNTIVCNSVLKQIKVSQIAANSTLSVYLKSATDNLAVALLEY